MTPARLRNLLYDGHYILLVVNNNARTIQVADSLEREGGACNRNVPSTLVHAFRGRMPFTHTHATGRQRFGEKVVWETLHSPHQGDASKNQCAIHLLQNTEALATHGERIENLRVHLGVRSSPANMAAIRRMLHNLLLRLQATTLSRDRIHSHRVVRFQSTTRHHFDNIVPFTTFDLRYRSCNTNTVPAQHYMLTAVTSFLSRLHLP